LSGEVWIKTGKEMTSAKHVLSETEGAQSAPSSEKKGKHFFFAPLASWRERKFLFEGDHAWS
jgi:hypothetical protein